MKRNPRATSKSPVRAPITPPVIKAVGVAPAGSPVPRSAQSTAYVGGNRNYGKLTNGVPVVGVIEFMDLRCIASKGQGVGELHYAIMPVRVSIRAYKDAPYSADIYRKLMTTLVQTGCIGFTPQMHETSTLIVSEGIVLNFIETLALAVKAGFKLTFTQTKLIGGAKSDYDRQTAFRFMNWLCHSDVNQEHMDFIAMHYNGSDIKFATDALYTFFLQMRDITHRVGDNVEVPLLPLNYRRSRHFALLRGSIASIPGKELLFV